MDLDQTQTPSTTANDQSFGPALIGSVNLSGDFENLAGPSVREATEYADDLARELIDDSNGIVREEHSQPEVVANDIAQDTVESTVTSAAAIVEENIGDVESQKSVRVEEQKSDKEEEQKDDQDEEQELDEVKIEPSLAEEAIQDVSLNTKTKVQDYDKYEEKSVELEKINQTQSIHSIRQDLGFEQDSLEVTEEQEEKLELQLDDREDSASDLPVVPKFSGSDEKVGDHQVSEQNELAEDVSGDTQQDGVDACDRPDLDLTEMAATTASAALDSAVAAIGSDTQSEDMELDSMENVVESTSFKEGEKKPDIMEFTKNYSDELLMGSSGEQRQQDQSNQGSVGHDLADFELPPYSGSSGSSASEQAQPTNAALTNMADNIASSSSTTLTSSDLTAIKNILVSSYSKFAHVFHWNKPIESGVFFVIGLTLIAALTFFSIISVVAYSALGVILASGLIRVYKASMKTMNKSPETPIDHIWEKALKLNVKMSPEKMHKLVDSSHGNLNSSMAYFKQVLLVEDKLATLKWVLFLYLLTYIGSWCNGLTLITISYLSLFSIPLLYEKNKTKIDEHLKMATNQITSTISTVTNKVSALILGTQSSATSKKQI